MACYGTISFLFMVVVLFSEKLFGLPIGIFVRFVA